MDHPGVETTRLLFFIVILQLCDNAGSTRPNLLAADVFDKHVSNEKEDPTRGVSKIVRIYKLFNHCSQQHVRIYGRNKERKKPIDANAPDTDEWAKLRVETSSFESQLRIQSNISMKYLCFNKKGKLKVRHSGKRDLCVFKETLEGDQYTMFQSVHNPRWKLGFNKRGAPLRGDSYKRKKGRARKKIMNCYRFTKREFKLYPIQGPDKPGDHYSPVGKGTWEYYINRNRHSGHSIRHRRHRTTKR